MPGRRSGGTTDTSRDYEFTDWDELDRFVEAFSKDVERRAFQPVASAPACAPA